MQYIISLGLGYGSGRVHNASVQREQNKKKRDIRENNGLAPAFTLTGRITNGQTWEYKDNFEVNIKKGKEYSNKQRERKNLPRVFGLQGTNKEIYGEEEEKVDIYIPPHARGLKNITPITEGTGPNSGKLTLKLKLAKGTKKCRLHYDSKQDILTRGVKYKLGTVKNKVQASWECHQMDMEKRKKERVKWRRGEDT